MKWIMVIYFWKSYKINWKDNEFINFYNIVDNKIPEDW